MQQSGCSTDRATQNSGHGMLEWHRLGDAKPRGCTSPSRRHSAMSRGTKPTGFVPHGMAEWYRSGDAKPSVSVGVLDNSSNLVHGGQLGLARVVGARGWWSPPGLPVLPTVCSRLYAPACAPACTLACALACASACVPACARRVLLIVCRCPSLVPPLVLSLVLPLVFPLVLQPCAPDRISVSFACVSVFCSRLLLVLFPCDPDGLPWSFACAHALCFRLRSDLNGQLSTN